MNKMVKQTIEEIRKIFDEHKLHFGRTVASSKRLYRDANPEHLVVFNARIYDLETYKVHSEGKIKDFFEGQSIELWYGDLDLNLDIYKLYQIARKIGPFVVTYEHGIKVIEVD